MPLIHIVGGLAFSQRKPRRLLFLLVGVLSLPPVRDPVLFVHHPHDEHLVGSVQGSYGNVPDRPELAAVVEVLVFQSEKVPDEPPKRTINELIELFWS